MANRNLTILGLAAAGGVGYYLYNAGGDPKVAQKQMEADASKATAKLKQELPGKEKEAQKKGEALASEAGAKLDQAVSFGEITDKISTNLKKSADARKKFEDAKKEANNLSQKAGTEVNKAIDKFDQSVTDGAAKAKSGISSWFGGK